MHRALEAEELVFSWPAVWLRFIHPSHPILFLGNFILHKITKVTCVSRCERLYALKHERWSWKTMCASAKSNKTPHF